MEELTWTGSMGAILVPLITLTAAVFLTGVVVQLVMGAFAPEVKLQSNPDGTLQGRGGLLGRLENYTGWLFMLLVALIVAFIVIAWFMPYGDAGILGEVSKRFLPTWIALIITFVLSITFKRRLGLYGKLFDSTIGMIGFGLVMFWVFTSIFVGLFDMIGTHDPLQQISGLKNKTPGVVVPEGQDEGFFPHYLLGGDNLARDIFTRMVHGSVIVMVIAPLATIFAFMVGITLGLPAGYYGGRLDTVLSFLANLILAFPVILLFYLLVTPEIVATGLPNFLAAFLFVFPLVFFGVLINSRYKNQAGKNGLLLALVLAPLAVLYFSTISDAGSPLYIWPEALDLFDIPGGILVVFVSVVFVNSPTVFRIVRGLALDIKTRDYVAAAQTRGEGPWYIMLWEILPNARGPLIVDFCLRIGYTTILLGTLGFFGLGLPPESPDWGSTINEGRKLLLIFAHPALPPAIALLSLVLGLNLLADGLREESLKD
ncbi:ABC transporter permease [Pseudooctadecabacter jejudonensis]|uniref:Glutathione transport system permease protein GsiD n=1 Tax=Pseudooctadecabacter jejudonensis TaxID=1391910 RepID=A0A1Y5RGZ8_9RHOB|nr:ABC transporter permease [Pseudooctadecabacter jejudonensis]SLN16952.1 Glutathione transport system permease protein GsiD [Pseudooctadecabacter jejudonensis]